MTNICKWECHKKIANIDSLIIKRCQSRSWADTRFCAKHLVLINDFSTELTDPALEHCSIFSIIKIIPKTYQQFKNVIEQMNYSMNDLQTTIKPYEGAADVTSNLYIELDNGERYYYSVNSTDKKTKKTDQLLFTFTKYCSGDTEILANGVPYCKQCYDSISHKINGPTIKSIKDNKSMLVEPQNPRIVFIREKN